MCLPAFPHGSSQGNHYSSALIYGHAFHLGVQQKLDEVRRFMQQLITRHWLKTLTGEQHLGLVLGGDWGQFFGTCTSEALAQQLHNPTIQYFVTPLDAIQVESAVEYLITQILLSRCKELHSFHWGKWR